MSKKNFTTEMGKGIIINGKNITEIKHEMKEQIQNEQVVEFQDLPTADKGREWDGAQARKNVAKWASSDGSGDSSEIDWTKYRKAFCWYDKEDDEKKAAYKFPIADVIDEELKAVFSGVVAAMAAINGARSEPDIPSDERKGVYNHLVKYYDKFDEEPPEYED